MPAKASIGDIVVVKTGRKTFYWKNSHTKRTTGFEVANLVPGGPNPGSAPRSVLARDVVKWEE